jgi:hypothetical protein
MKLTMVRGDTPTWKFACKQKDGSPLPLSSGKLFFTAKSSTRQPDIAAAFQKKLTSGITVTDANAGLCSVELSSADTASLYAPSILHWDLQYVTTGNKVYTLATGDLHISADVTIGIS